MLVLRCIALAAGLLAAVSAHAHYGWTMQDANVRAGPAREYPLVGWLPLGSVVLIHGCIQGWRWCDVEAQAEGMRGFVYSGFLAYPYGDGYVSVRDAGPYLGIPILPFVLEPYWSLWYWNRPWYQDRRWWADRPYPPPPHWRPRPQPPVGQSAPPTAIVPPLDLAVPPITQPVPRFESAPPPARRSPPAGSAPRPPAPPSGARPDPRSGERP